MIAGDSTLPTARKRRRFQFSLGGLMVFVFGVAVGLSTATMGRFSWYDGVVAAALAWITLGLVHQLCDLWRAFHDQSRLTSDERWGWRFAVFWRLGVIGLLASRCGVSILLEFHLIALSGSGDGFYLPGRELRDAVVPIAVIIVLSSLLPALPDARCGLRAHLLNLAGLAAAVVLSVLICWDKTTVQLLVTTAIHDVEMAWPLHLAREGVEILPGARTGRFFRECSLALGLGLASLCLTYGLAHGWNGGRRQRVAWTVALAVALPSAVFYLIWVCLFAMPRAFPIVVDAQTLGPLHVWFTAVLLLLVLVTAGTYRLVGSTGRVAQTAELNWRRDQGRYHHERRAVILVLGVGIAAPLVVMMFWIYREPPWGGWQIVLQVLLSQGSVLLAGAVCVAAVCAVWRLTRRKNVDEEQSLSPISVRHFATVWFALLLSTAVVIPALMLVGVGLWFSPWCRGGWP